MSSQSGSKPEEMAVAADISPDNDGLLAIPTPALQQFLRHPPSAIIAITEYRAMRQTEMANLVVRNLDDRIVKALNQSAFRRLSLMRPVRNHRQPRSICR